MSPQGQHRSFLTLSPTQEQLTSIQEKDTPRKILEHGGKTKALPRNSKTRKDYIRVQWHFFTEAENTPKIYMSPQKTPNSHRYPDYKLCYKKL